MACNFGTSRSREPSAALLVAAIGATLVSAILAGPPVFSQPAFSGGNCSRARCDCNCIAGEEQRAAAALVKLEIDLPGALTLSPGRLTPQAAVARLELLRRKIAELLLAVTVAETNPAGRLPPERIRAELATALRALQLPPPSAGWDYDERYLDSLARSVGAELRRAAENIATEKLVRQEIDLCRSWADKLQCDPSLGTQGGTTPPRAAPPSAPPAVTPPREMPPSDGPLPIGHHADGRVDITDELLSRYVAASRARYLQGGASYWQAGRMGQADYAEIDARLLEWFRYKDVTAERYARFDDAEQEVLTRRSVEATKAYNGDW